MELIVIVEKFLWSGAAALGFAILFNVPSRVLAPVFIMGGIGGLTKAFLISTETNVVLASFAGATIIGLLSIPFAHNKHAPPPVFAIPSVIPMVPGIFAYRMMLGLIDLAGSIDPATYNQILAQTVNNGLKVMFILMSLAAGVGVPMLITRKESAKEIRLRKTFVNKAPKGWIKIR